MKILKLREHGELLDNAAAWFHSKWGIPLEEYRKSISDCLENKGDVPQWYIILENIEIIGGAGVIENDFHNRKDLAPNICALYIKEEYRCRGFAGQLLQYICEDMNHLRTDTLYLITNHTSFYERYGWTFLCMVQGDEEPDMTRMYIHKGRIPEA